MARFFISVDYKRAQEYNKSVLNSLVKVLRKYIVVLY